MIQLAFSPKTYSGDTLNLVGLLFSEIDVPDNAVLIQWYPEYITGTPQLGYLSMYLDGESPDISRSLIFGNNLSYTIALNFSVPRRSKSIKIGFRSYALSGVNSILDSVKVSFTMKSGF